MERFQLKHARVVASAAGYLSLAGEMWRVHDRLGR
jgi:hypothetical protein